jgi:flagellar motility protein MotE (MotC chaperone)
MKRLYHILALVAIIHLFAIAGLMGFLFATDKLNAERIDRIADVIRGEYPETQPAAPATQPTEERKEETPEQSTKKIERQQEQRRQAELLAERNQQELQYRFDLNQQILYEASQKLDRIEQLKQELEKQKEAFAKKTEQQGFEKMVEVLEGMQAKNARDLLMERKDADVVRIFMALDSNILTDIVNQCKQPDQKEWVGRILTRMEKRQAANGVDGPNAPINGG